MTKLKKPVRRETNAMVREAGKPREIIIILRQPNVLGFKAKGCRREYTLTAEVCYTMAVRADVAAKKNQRYLWHKLKLKRQK